MTMRGMIPSEELETFALAGDAIFTVQNVETGNRFTYRVQQAKDRDEQGEFTVRRDFWFVKALTGPDNESHYEYLGTINKRLEYTHGRKSRIANEAQCAKAFWFVWKHRARLSTKIAINHEGRCGRCARTLTVPESVDSGFGPECIKKIAA